MAYWSVGEKQPDKSVTFAHFAHFFPRSFVTVFAEAPVKQQAIELPIVSIHQCVNIYARTLPISDEQICAGGELGRDACSGFGGAPLLVRHGDTHYQVGILSFGSDQCGAAGVPSVYTNIKKYVAWIRDNIPVIYDNEK